MVDRQLRRYEATLRDGTPYAVAIPPRWNGTLLVDLDFMTVGDGPSYRAILEAGYGAAGLCRNYVDPPGGQVYGPWVARMTELVERARATVGKPERILAVGNSRGGSVALGLAKLPPQVLDGALVKGTHASAIGFMNQVLDLAFCLKALLSSDAECLPLVNLSEGPATPRPVGIDAAVEAWNAVLDRACATRAGRARITLAAALAQANPWVDPKRPRPSCNEPRAIAAGWVRTVRAMFAPLSGVFFYGRPIFETSARGNPSWNAGVDYAAFLHGRAQNVVEAVYHRAGMDLAADLARIATSERIVADASARGYIEQTTAEDAAPLRVPVLTLSTVGDPFVPLSSLRFLEDLALHQNDPAILRSAFVERTGHCTFEPFEDLTCLQVLAHRLDRGQWGDEATAAALNGRARSLCEGKPCFVEEVIERYNRAPPIAPQVP